MKYYGTCLYKGNECLTESTSVHCFLCECD